MKMKYEAPEAEIEVFETEDVLAISAAESGQKGVWNDLDWTQLK